MNFIIINDIRQPMKHLYTDLTAPRWIHHATIKRGFKEYIIFRDQISGQIYLEEVEQHRATMNLKKIQDDHEWADLYRFATAAGLLDVVGEEIKAYDAF